MPAATPAPRRARRSPLDRLLRAGEARTLRSLSALVAQVNALGPVTAAMSDGELAAQTDHFRDRLAAGASVDTLVPEAFATVREAATRVLGLRHFDVQLLGGAALHRGMIAQMATGH